MKYLTCAAATAKKYIWTRMSEYRKVLGLFYVGGYILVLYVANTKKQKMFNFIYINLNYLLAKYVYESSCTVQKLRRGKKKMSELPTSVKVLRSGYIVGFLKLLKRTKSNLNDSTIRRKKWRVKCMAPNCGTEFTVPQNYLVRKPKPKTHCGCQNKTLKTICNREYRIWLMMNARCTDKKHVTHVNYHKKVIDVDPLFAKNNPEGFENFLSHVGRAPTPMHALGRIDNAGNYAPGNLHWITRKK